LRNLIIVAYSQIATSTIFFPRYWLSRHVAQQAKGFPERGYAKWVVLHFTWEQMSSVLRKKALKRVFCTVSESALFPELSKAVNAVYKGTSAYHKANRGLRAKQIDPSSFFKRTEHHIEFKRFWGRRVNRHRQEFTKAWAAFEQRIDRLANE
jgi:hypothetical protein